MRHFKHLLPEEEKRIFYKKPQEVCLDSPKSLLSYALGATLYMPGTKQNILEILINRKYPSLTSVVICLEDAIGDENVRQAENNLFKTIRALRKAVDDYRITPSEIPFLFVRVRDIFQFKTLLDRSSELDLLCGFVFPKFSSSTGYAYLEALEQANMKYGTSFYAMPILESEKIIYKETRIEEMMAIKELLDRNRDRILNVRIGATDFSSLFSIRRGMDFTIYDIQVISDCISDIVNVFGRAEQSYVISGPVWEYFPVSSRLLKPQLRATPFERKGVEGREKRAEILHESIDGLIKEVILDKANGLTGKTIIHPSHIRYVNALQSVTLEEYEDAKQIMDNIGQGVLKSTAGNKMNEIKPHMRWAQKILTKAEIYGVINKDEDYTALFE